MATHTVMDERTKAALKVAYQQGVGGAEDVDVDFGDDDQNVEPLWFEQPVPDDETASVTALRYTCKAGAGVLHVLDTVGEWLAAFFGITTPRYQYVLDDLIARQREVERA
ncbi:hypothetical protein PTSG_10997 [Salpingoeca rosetta]|uniref:Uncharacterized protein n=1 Tax=Salpingoeca rosetta (strain ATCC 50818 / BSB-021) TaxID=946362 RepID=F2USE4_SALR5|nr:uncharacterized protein PTSG_10997 [Salpingoeca rosetta]EGD81053.1 hypothetical protein PTSG_10997 [Salpingoeca rosetta]|eukprot:XP_004987923.1 hypothetical protein PTSG_10997 [Salpingoeca rosetta]